jgi:GAF domain-containing protein
MTHDEGPGLTELQLLQSVTDAARNLFGAAAASVFLVDPETGELVFEAVSGEGEGHLPGTRFPPGTGIVGWVASSGQPMLIDDVSGAAQFARSAAESTGYVPRSIMAAPLIREGECLGVIEILDSGSQRRGELQDVDLLGLLATQAAIGVELLARLRWPAGNGISGAVPEAAVPAVLLRISSRMQAADKQTADVVAKLLATADELLGAPRGPAGTIRRTP